MWRKTVLVVVIALFAGALFTPLAFAGSKQAAGARTGKFLENHPRLAEKFKELPRWKQDAIRAVLHQARERIKSVRRDGALTKPQKIAKVREIRRETRQNIRHILHAGKP